MDMHALIHATRLQKDNRTGGSELFDFELQSEIEERFSTDRNTLVCVNWTQNSFQYEF